MNYLTREKASKLILEIGLPDFFIDVINENVTDPVDLHFACSPLYYLSEGEQKAYEFGDIIPLWASYSGDINFAYDIHKKDYFLFFLEEGEIEQRYNWDQLMKQAVETAMEHEFDADIDNADAIKKVKLIFSGLKLNKLDTIIKEVQDDWGKYT